MNAPSRILLVEDDLRLARLMQEYLQASDELDVRVETRGDRAVDRILDELPDLVILDLMLPGLDGLSVCKQVRERYPGPILMLSALGDEVDEVVGLELGADDYVAKPASPRLVLARVRTLLRRINPESQSPGRAPTSSETAVELGDLVVDPGRRAALLNGEELDLTTAEFDLLWLLARHAGEPLDREAIYRELKGTDWDGLDRSIDLRILRLRKKLGDDARNPRRIKSVRGVGYLLARPAPVAP
ncbi:MAG: winged helix-turn-helix domain-containing protein [Deltaproteobacteria bacterium]|nr:winged helix-turn-helix domain-containing protein [Deltaproteobacteria bacterium]